jgi:hypothetical protein
MKLLKSSAFLMGLLVTGVLLPFQANATGSVGVPEPVSLALLAAGAAGVGAAAWFVGVRTNKRVVRPIFSSLSLR